MSCDSMCAVSVRCLCAGEKSPTRSVHAVPVVLSNLVFSPHPKSAVKACTTKCVSTCTRGGSGAPGLGPASVRKEIIVFKEGFRSRAYCLSECTNICTSLKDMSKK